MAANWISDIAWTEPGPKGKPYRTFLMDGPGMKKGERTYVTPAEVHPSNTTDARLLEWAAGNARPGLSYLKERGRWDAKTGEWDRPMNWTNILSTAVGALIGGPLVANAFSGTAAPAPLASGTTAPTAGATAPLASSTAVPVSTAMTATPATVGGGSTTMGWVDTLLGLGKDALTDPKTYVDIGRTLTAGSQSQANNRGTQIEAILAKAAQELLTRNSTGNAFIDREKSIRDEQADAWKRTLQSDYVRSGVPVAGPGVSPYSKPIPGVGSSAEVREAAQKLFGTSTGRLDTAASEFSNLATNRAAADAMGNTLTGVQTPMQTASIEDLMDPGLWEKILGYTGAGADVWGTLRRNRAKPQVTDEQGDL